MNNFGIKQIGFHQAGTVKGGGSVHKPFGHKSILDNGWIQKIKERKMN
jgi:hypothetical protein